METVYTGSNYLGFKGSIFSYCSFSQAAEFDIKHFVVSSQNQGKKEKISLPPPAKPPTPKKTKKENMIKITGMSDCYCSF